MLYFFVIVCLIGCVAVSGCYLNDFLEYTEDSIIKNLMLFVAAILPSFMGFCVLIGSLENREWFFLKALSLTLITTAICYFLLRIRKKNYRKRFLEFWQGLKSYNRCPNCETSFFKNGQGGLETALYIVDGKESYAEEVEICLKCLENSALLDKEKIRRVLQKRGYAEDTIKDSLHAVDMFLQGKIPYATWRNAR